MSGKRSYTSPSRELGAAETRASILREASELFAVRGYARVSVADIAAAAGVAAKTVYASVGGKAAILNEIVDRAVAESPGAATVVAVRNLSGIDEVLRELASGTRRGNEGQAVPLEAVHKALPVHEEGEALWERTTASYLDALARVAEHLQALGALRSGLSTGEAADLLWLWFGPTAWRTLVIERGWSWDRAEEALYRSALASLR
ncbi:TetR/AcrR family transcriptional regulator [uncultured Arthrobacter sp.]|uniref:TetR/AcrR family transcriptional regulator n=1 Tax=uncultured Arthrobacter sp. TaxID=114050 RepID=UPI0025FB2459|nr:TetR family transcriptional regulator [uncultured Arthrobacter sp.]